MGSIIFIGHNLNTSPMIITPESSEIRKSTENHIFRMTVKQINKRPF